MNHLQFFICLNLIALPLVIVCSARDEQKPDDFLGMMAFGFVFINLIAFGIRLAVIWSR